MVSSLVEFAAKYQAYGRLPFVPLRYIRWGYREAHRLALHGGCMEGLSSDWERMGLDMMQEGKKSSMRMARHQSSGPEKLQSLQPWSISRPRWTKPWAAGSELGASAAQGWEQRPPVAPAARKCLGCFGATRASHLEVLGSARGGITLHWLLTEVPVGTC